MASTQSVNDKTIPVSLFNYHPTELRMMLVYGTELQHLHKEGIEKLQHFKSTHIIWAIMLLASGVLCFVRRKLRLPHDGFISSYIDVMIIFFAGGNIRIIHRIEKYFFASLWIAIFFLNAIYCGLMFDIVWLYPSGIALTIHQIKTIQPPVFLSPTLRDNEQSIKGIIRFGFEFCTFPFFGKFPDFQ